MLNSLEIKNFRMLEDFKVEKLGRVNLIVGKNNSGKSTVLEALRIYAGNANPWLLRSIAMSHDEPYPPTNPDEPNAPRPFEDLFTGRRFPEEGTEIVIGESANSDQALHINFNGLSSAQPQFDEHSIDIRKGDDGAFPIFFNDASVKSTTKILGASATQWFFNKYTVFPCSFVPTQLVSTEELAKEWDKIVFTEHEEVIKQAMRIILPTFENLAFVGEMTKRATKVKLADSARPVPLNSLGDGMSRILQLVLKIFPSKDGFLLIDEFENGLHYSIQEKVWQLVFEMAERLNIQVFATTHSWDCIDSFSKVAMERAKDEGVLFRVGKSALTSDKGKVIATVFSGDELATITQAAMEVR